jgi:choline dehydrogenase-like flavoprotein
VGAGMGGSSLAGEIAKLNSKINIAIISEGSKNTKNPYSTEYEINKSEKNLISKNFLGRGGNTRIYGGQLERMNQKNFFESKKYIPDVHFPIKFQELKPYYEKAERLLGAKNINNNKSDIAIKNAVKKSGFTLKDIKIGIKDIKGCDGCGGKICTKNCKIDSFSAFITTNLKIYDNFEVEKVEKIGEKFFISNINKNQKLSCKTLVLCSGAISSTILLRKFLQNLRIKVKDEEYNLPVGKGITFHISDFFLLIPKFFSLPSGRKIINTSEFKHNSIFASFQSVGAPLRKDYIESFLKKKYLLKSKTMIFFIKIISFFAEYVLRTSHVIATIVEDPVKIRNKIAVDTHSLKSKVKLNYKLDFSVKKNIKDLNKHIRKKLSDKFFVIPFGGECNLNLGHIMGGCRCGETPKNSVVDKSLKVWGVQGLYICDSSVIPCSGTSNPSLTIAALGLRLAKKLAKR